MILSHSHRFIFLKTRKTAGTSLEIALSKYVSPEDVVTPIAPADEKIRAGLGYLGPQNHLTDGARQHAGSGQPETMKFRNHMEARDIRERVPAEVFDSYLKVAVVRNPFDVAVSWYFWERSRLGPTSRDDFRKWLAFQFVKRPELEAAYRRRETTNPGLFASNRLITHIDGRSVVDMMIRYEAFESDIGRFAARVGLPASLYGEFSQVSAKGGYRPAGATTSMMFEGFTEGRAMIEREFAEEIETYRYGLI